MNTAFGRNISVTVYGSSHASCVGAVALGFPKGIFFTKAELKAEMARRAPGRELTSPRKESDEVNFLSGVIITEDAFITDGSPIRVEIANTNVRISDYEKMDYYRPSHGDYTYSLKYPGRTDNHPSGRLTAPLIPLGLIAKKELGISVLSHIKQLGPFTDENFPEIPDELLINRLHNALIPTVAEDGADVIAAYIHTVQADGDSCGAMVETRVTNIPAGLGEPYFRGLDAALSEILFSIPGLRAMALGDALDFPLQTGSEVNDSFVVKNGEIATKTNHSGGVNAGISNGMPLVFSTVFRPTPSVSKKQHTVDFVGNERIVSILGRHDPCFALRAIPVIEAGTALALLDLSLENSKGGSLADFRQEIGNIDSRIAMLVKERKELAERIGLFKKENGLPISQPSREKEETDRILHTFFADADGQEQAHVRFLMEELYRYSRFVQGDKSEEN